MASFDVFDRTSWYFGSMSRQDATDLLMNERESGVFLVRDSKTILGDYVLCVREDTKVSHYIINKIQQQDQTAYRIGDQSFTDLSELLSFYKLHYLDTTPLRRPATRRIERVIGKFDFDGSDQDDLPFRRGEILTIISKDEDQWWTAKNAAGQIGQIPVPYVQKYEENGQNNTLERPGSGGGGGGVGGVINSNMNQVLISNSGNVNNCNVLNSHQLGSALKKSDLNRKLPAFARVKQARVPNAYDKTALKLEVDDIIKVTKTNINGQWEGELRGRKGHFPFTHVEFIDDNELLLNTSSTATTTTNASATATVAANSNNIAVTGNNCNNGSNTTTATPGGNIIVGSNEWVD